MEVKSPARASDRPGGEARPAAELDFFANPKRRLFLGCVLAIEKWVCCKFELEVEVEGVPGKRGSGAACTMPDLVHIAPVLCSTSSYVGLVSNCLKLSTQLASQPW